MQTPTSAPSGTGCIRRLGMKTAPAMGKQNYSISTSLTGDSGEAFLTALTSPQRKSVADLVDLQRKTWPRSSRLARAIANELRRFLKAELAEKNKVLSLVATLRRAGWRALVFIRVGLRQGRQVIESAAETEAGRDAHVETRRTPRGRFCTRPRSTCQTWGIPIFCSA